MARIAEYKKRKSRYDLQSVVASKADELIADGWERAPGRGQKIRLKRSKSFDELLENDFWTVLYLFGYPNLNAGRKFTVELSQHGGKPITKQIDVLAFDDETVVVAECKACETRSKRSLRKDISEFEANKKAIANALKHYLGKDGGQKFLWLFVTRNIEWSTTDRGLAEQHNIRIVSERDLRYFSEIAKRLGPAGRFQFHATYLAATKVDALRDVKVPAIRTKVGGCQAYFFVAPARKLLPISYVNHRDLRDPEAAPSYQRLITRNRLQAVANFIHDGGYFANAIIVNFKNTVRFDQAAPQTEDGTTMGMLTLPSDYKSVWVIDGQHRLYGYAELAESHPTHRVPVIAFEKLASEEEGRLFKTINSQQKMVSPGLLDELRGEQDLHSEDRQRQSRAIAARIIEQLRSDVGGPFEDRFKSADLPDGPERTLTITSIINAITSSGLIGRMRSKPTRFIQGPLSGDTPTQTINSAASTLSDYFDLVRQANIVRWDAGKAGMLCTNVAVEAYIRLLGELCPFIHRETGNDPRNLTETELLGEVGRYLEPILEVIKTATDHAFSQRFKVPFGSGGPTRYFHRLADIVKAKFPSFAPVGYDDFVKESEEEITKLADQRVRIIQEQVPAFIVSRLKRIYDGEKYLQQAIKNKDILEGAFKKQLAAEVDDQGPLETYIDFIDFRKIVETKENWPNFSDILSIRLPDESHAARYLKWFDEVNRIRRIPAHPFGKKYKERDIEVLESVFDSLLSSGVIGSNA
ncbi:DGQHR domain-containing protein [Bosea sp. BH3]|uniref:DGQHR domain-containing protein n=1 Tax=Bosea sp. BH3 TaxID=2871701 RepID=UPI0021CB1CC2|nr:DGQHR domain-containing protein [Bosea sp. BH3]MCU4180196.1 DGQHR domain-containing protein [Bosea sp. BH3]